MSSFVGPAALDGRLGVVDFISNSVYLVFCGRPNHDPPTAASYGSEPSANMSADAHSEFLAGIYKEPVVCEGGVLRHDKRERNDNATRRQETSFRNCCSRRSK